MDGSRSRAVKSFAVSLLCYLVFLLPPVTDGAAFLLFLVANTAFLVGLLSSFDDAIPAKARLAIGFLVFAAAMHLWAGAIAAQPINGLIARPMLEFSTTYPIATLLHVIDACAVQSPCGQKDLWVNWSDDAPFEIAAVSMIVSSLFAIVAAVIMARRGRLGDVIWFAIAAVSTTAGLWMILANASISVGGVGVYYEKWGPPLWWSLCPPLSYAIAWWFARKNVELK